MNIADTYLAVGQQSPETLVRDHRALVRRIAYHLVARLPANVDVDDLIQSGTIGLLEAARNYDPRAGASFETFAGIRIRGAMLDELRRGDWVPRSTHRRSRDMASAIHRVEGRTGRAAEAAEIAAEMDVSVDEYARIAADASRGPWLSLDEMPEGWSEDLSSNTPSPAEEVEKSGFATALTQAIDALPEREKLALSLYYEQDLNLKEIGAVLGVSESRVCQLHGQAQARLRARLKDWIN